MVTRAVLFGVQLKKTVDIDNSDFLKDLENLCQKWQLNPPSKLIVDFVHGIELPEGLGSPLEALGLFIKNDLEEEVEHEMEDSVSTSLNADVEEGEISCSQQHTSQTVNLELLDYVCAM